MPNCIICFDSIQSKNKIKLSCNHIFHYNCIKTMIMKRSRCCPLCRRKIRWNVSTLNKIFTEQQPKILRKSPRKIMISEKF